jgi:hypothetical protein
MSDERTTRNGESPKPQPEHIFSFDMSSLVMKSVATLYSHLITRPTGKAIRLGIESQICDHGGRCVCVLDFAQVVILDYSCADEAVAKLIQRFEGDDRPADAYFMAKGLAEQHREPMEELLVRHCLVLAAEADGMGHVLLGAPGMVEQLAWASVQRLSFATAAQVAQGAHHSVAEVESALETLVQRRALVASESPPGFYSLTAMLAVAEES